MEGLTFVVAEGITDKSKKMEVEATTFAQTKEEEFTLSDGSKFKFKPLSKEELL